MDVTKNPFWVLGVSLDDETETVEDRIAGLEDDQPHHDWRAFARRLQKPQDRIRCEVAWLPGLDPHEALKAATISLKGGQVAVGERSALANTNLHVMRLVAGGTVSVDEARELDLGKQLLRIADAWERVDPVAVAQQINVHRARAGLRAKATGERVRTALREHHSWITAIVWNELGKLPVARMVATFQTLSESATRNGKRRAPEAVRDWIKKYENEYEQRFVKQKVGMEALAKDALAALQRKDAKEAERLTGQFCQALSAWDQDAQPIQLMYQSEGTTDPKTEEVFAMARDLSLSLHNVHGESALAARIVATQRRVFKEAERLDERLEQDVENLAEILRKKKEAAAALQIEPFVGHVGLRRKVVEVTNDYIRFGTQIVNLDDVTKCRWGGTRGYYWTSYDVGVSTSGGQVLEIATVRSKLYEQVTQRLWKVCGNRIAAEMTVALTEGKAVAVGDVKILDGNILLRRSRWLRSQEAAWVPLPRTEAEVVDGRVMIRSRQEPKWKSGFSLREDWNGMLLWAILGPHFNRTEGPGTK